MRFALTSLLLLVPSFANAQLTLPWAGSVSDPWIAWVVQNNGTGGAALFSATSSGQPAFQIDQQGSAPALQVSSLQSTGMELNVGNGTGFLLSHVSNSGAQGLRVDSNCLGIGCTSGMFTASGANSVGVWASGTIVGVQGTASTTGVLGRSFTQSGTGIKAEQLGSGAVTGFAIHAVSTNGVAGRFESSTTNLTTAAALSAQAFSASPSIIATNSSNGVGIKATTTTGTAVVASSTGLNGVQGSSSASFASGVYGENLSGGFGVAGRASGSGTGVLEDLASPSGGYAGFFNGRVHVSGTLSKTAGTFRIDHPQDPTGKYLVHSFVESPDMKNVYDGLVVLDQGGEAVVVLPQYFEALNRDFRYQLTPIGRPAGLYIKEEVSDGRFRVAGGSPGMKVSWQVTGIRKDPWALQNPLIVEETKRGAARGKYLNPEVFGHSRAEAEMPGPSQP